MILTSMRVAQDILLECEETEFRHASRSGDQGWMRPDGLTSQFCLNLHEFSAQERCSVVVAPRRSDVAVLLELCMSFERQCSWIQVRPLDTKHRLLWRICFEFKQSDTWPASIRDRHCAAGLVLNAQIIIIALMATVTIIYFAVHVLSNTMLATGHKHRAT